MLKNLPHLLSLLFSSCTAELWTNHTTKQQYCRSVKVVLHALLINPLSPNIHVQILQTVLCTIS